MSGIEISAKDIEAFERPGPRYTSYPTAPVWNEPFEAAPYAKALGQLSSDTELSLYIHLPFCVRLCHFCACNKVIDKDHKLGSNYLKALFKEIEVVSKLLVNTPNVMQLHLGGGTPTYYPPSELGRLMDFLKKNFKISPSAELSIEANPVVTHEEHLRVLRDSGFWRISFGVQDFDSKVQEIINREQTFEQTKALTEQARKLGFSSVNVDLIYGLPLQTIETITRTIDSVNSLRPDRIALYSFALVPWKQPFQRRFKDEDLPTGLDKINLYLEARKLLEATGYQAVGMDHFALPHDELFQARRDKVLHRNFMGYTTKPHTQMIGLGTSGISMLNSIYTQNDRNLNEYQRRASLGELPIHRGFSLSLDDQMRRDLIMTLMCNFEVSFSEIEAKYGASFEGGLKKELSELERLKGHGLLELSEGMLKILPKGQVLVRNIAMIFDRYLSDQERPNLFSKTI